MPVVTATFTVAAGEDDADQFADLSGFSATGANVTATSDPGVTARKATGLRFRGVTIPRRARIIAARLEANVSGSTKLDDAAAVIYAEDADNAPTYAADARVWGRPTVGSILWYQTDLGGGWRSAPDLASLVSAVTFRAGQAPGQPVNLILHGQNGANAALTFAAYEEATDGVGARAARLHVTYETNPLDTPAVSFVRDSGAQATASWPAVTGAASYVVLVQRDTGGVWVDHEVRTVTGTSAVFTGLDPALNYRARTRAHPP